VLADALASALDRFRREEKERSTVVTDRIWREDAELA
jgi:hypothetical protein